jgi:hypothetical protein
MKMAEKIEKEMNMTEEGDGTPHGGAIGVAVWCDAVVCGWRCGVMRWCAGGGVV